MAPSTNRKKKNKKKTEGESEETRKRTQEDEDLALAMKFQQEEFAALQQQQQQQKQQQQQRPQRPQQQQPQQRTLSFFGKTSPEALSKDELQTFCFQFDVPFTDDDSDLLERCRRKWRDMEQNMRQPQQQSAPAPPPPPPPTYNNYTPPSSGRMVAGVERVELSSMKSVEDVCNFARSQARFSVPKVDAPRRSQVVDSKHHPTPWRWTKEFHVDDKELENLKDVYLAFIAKFASSSEIEDEYFNNETVAWVLLTFLEYPFLVFSARKFVHATKANAPQMKAISGFGVFPLAVVVERIAHWRRLQQWCRRSIGDQRCEDAIVASSLRLLACAAVGTTKPRLRRILQISDEDDSSLEATCSQLSSDIALKVFKKRNLGSVDELFAVQLPVLLCASVDASKLGHIYLIPDSRKCSDEFASAFDRVTHLMDDNCRDELNEFIFNPKPQETSTPKGHIATDEHGRDDTWGATTTTRKCDNPGCTGIGSKRCACRLVAYCSNECQIKHWQLHKTICVAKKKKKKKKENPKDLNDDDDDEETKQKDTTTQDDNDDETKA